MVIGCSDSITSTQPANNIDQIQSAQDVGDIDRTQPNSVWQAPNNPDQTSYNGDQGKDHWPVGSNIEVPFRLYSIDSTSTNTNQSSNYNGGNGKDHW